MNIERQFIIAQELAASDTDARIGFVCDFTKFRELIYEGIIAGGIASVINRVITMPSGGKIIWISTNHERVMEENSGRQYTGIFLTEIIPMKSVNYLKSRLRSATYKKPLTLYHSYGICEKAESYE